MRSVPEWIGKTPNTPIPPRVKLRVRAKWENRCYLSGLEIGAKPWDTDHIIAICNGGENKESNLAPVLKAPHKEKTKLDVATKSKTARMRARHLGIKKRGRTIPGRKFNGTPIPSRWR